MCSRAQHKHTSISSLLHLTYIAPLPKHNSDLSNKSFTEWPMLCMTSWAWTATLPKRKSPSFSLWHVWASQSTLPIIKFTMWPMPQVWPKILKYHVPSLITSTEKNARTAFLMSLGVSINSSHYKNFMQFTSAPCWIHLPHSIASSMMQTILLLNMIVQ